MPERKIKIFISHISDEKAEANRAKAFLEKSFGDSVEIFSASTWDSISPGDDWFARIEQGINTSDIVLVFASPESINRPWINFETGAAWMQKKKVVPVCWMGMTPDALPEPIRRLQAVDINSSKPTESLSKLAEAVRKTGELPRPKPISLEELSIETGKTGTVQLSTWMRRPHAHIGESTEGIFKVGEVDACFIDRAKEAGVDPKDALRVKLFIESDALGGSTSPYINAIVAGKTAALFESEEINSKMVKAKIKLQNVHTTADYRYLPLIVIESAKLLIKG